MTITDTSQLHAIHEMSPSSNLLQPSPLTPEQFVITTPPTVKAHNDPYSSEEFIKKRPLRLTEDLVAGRIPSHSRARLSPLTASPKRLTIEELRYPCVSSDLATTAVNPVTPPSKYHSRTPAPVHDVSSQRAAELVCYAHVRRHVKKTRSPKSRRSCTSSSPTKSPLCSTRVLRSRSPLIRWTSPSGFYSPESTHYPITPMSNTASVIVVTNCPWTISSSSSSPYSPYLP